MWHIDVLINRALVYGTLTGTLAVAYIGLIIVLQYLLRDFIGGNQLAIVGSTLVIALLFQPLRRRVQMFINRRFYRRKYDAARAPAEFSEVLREEVDLTQLSERLIVVVVVSSYFSSHIMSYGSTNELFQSRLINCVALTEIYCSRFFRIKAGIEEFLRIFQQSALKKVHFYRLLESADSTNQPPVRPYRGIPFPFLSDVGVGLADKFAQSGDHLAAPVGKFCDLCVDTFRWVHSFLLGPCLRF